MKQLSSVKLIIFLIFATLSCTDDDKTTNPIDPGSTAPDFSLQSLDGNQVKLSDYDDSVVVLFFLGSG